ncbi:MAG: hypothetical protein DYG94_00165 [Leptolyngbya sp. PLA3]|nr:MAG: hypothetical protein EDM82_01710 [Cyanobacteria bacterium CYA]MCE7967149.1 hypothetical protein [Leptolyngbya sp. PL-A3]
MLAYLVADLMWGSKIASAAQAAGRPARRVRSWDDTRSLLEQGTVRLVLVDLTDPAAGEIVAQTPVVAGSGGRVIAFGPHVDTEAFERARACGAEVLPRGALIRRLDEIMGTQPGG